MMRFDANKSDSSDGVYHATGLISAFERCRNYAKELAVRIGVDLGGTKIEVIALDDAGETSLRRRVPTPAGDYDATIRTIVELVRDAQAKCGPSATVGIATPGALSPRTGLLRNSNSVVLNGKPLDRDISSALGLPVRLENDANCLAISEAVDGAAGGYRNVFGVILGTGVGGGIVIDKQVVSGRNRIAGEWGHNPLPWAHDNERPGHECYCGKRGCVETFLAGVGLSREYSSRSSRNLNAEEIVAAAESGDAHAIQSIAAYSDRLARSLAAVINILDPDVIVLGGGLSNIESLYPGLPDLIGKYAFSDGIKTTVIRAVHGDSSGVRGAAWLWPKESR